MFGKFSRIFRPINQANSAKSLKRSRLSLNRTPTNSPNKNTKVKSRPSIHSPLTIRRYSKLNSPNKQDPNNKTSTAKHSIKTRRSMKSMRAHSASNTHTNQSKIEQEHKFSQLMKLNKQKKHPSGRIEMGNILGVKYTLDELNEAIKTFGFDPYVDGKEKNAHAKLWSKYIELEKSVSYKDESKKELYKKRLRMYEILLNHVRLLRIGVENI